MITLADDDGDDSVREVDFSVVCAECGEDLGAKFDAYGKLNVVSCGCAEGF